MCVRVCVCARVFHGSSPFACFGGTVVLLLLRLAMMYKFQSSSDIASREMQRESNEER